MQFWFIKVGVVMMSLSIITILFDMAVFVLLDGGGLNTKAFRIICAIGIIGLILLAVGMIMCAVL